MNHNLLQQYIKLTEFLGIALGPDYEVTLHDLCDVKKSIIAIANGHISGRTIGAPLNALAMQALENKEYLEKPFRMNYSALAMENGNMLRSSTLFILDENAQPIGLLCINFDDSRYRDLSEKLLKLRHPDAFVETHFVYDKEKAQMRNLPEGIEESFHESVSSVTQSTIAQLVVESGVPANRLTLEEKMEIIRALDEKGVFLLKNAVKEVARQLHCSQASVYRYMNKLSKTE